MVPWNSVLYSALLYLSGDAVYICQPKYSGGHHIFIYLLYHELCLYRLLDTENSEWILFAQIVCSLIKFNIAIFLFILWYLQQIPEWWAWCYWICPAAWTLNALVTSQYGDIRKKIEVFGEHKQLDVFLKDYFGFQQDQLPFVAAILVALPLLFASLFVISSAKLNFQKR